MLETAAKGWNTQSLEHKDNVVLVCKVPDAPSGKPSAIYTLALYKFLPYFLGNVGGSRGTGWGNPAPCKPSQPGLEGRVGGVLSLITIGGSPGLLQHFREQEAVLLGLGGIEGHNQDKP